MQADSEANRHITNFVSVTRFFRRKVLIFLTVVVVGLSHEKVLAETSAFSMKFACGEQNACGYKIADAMKYLLRKCDRRILLHISLYCFCNDDI